MTATSSIPPSSGGTRPGGMAGYRQMRTVEVRAASTRYDEDAHMRQALDRLGRTLGSGQPPRSDVPPGFYLNIVV